MKDLYTEITNFVNNLGYDSLFSFFGYAKVNKAGFEKDYGLFSDYLTSLELSDDETELIRRICRNNLSASGLLY